MLLARPPTLPRLSPFHSSSRPSPHSACCISAACPPRRSLLVCCAKRERKADGRGDDGKPARLWTGGQDTWSAEEATPPSTPPPQRGRTSNSRPPRSPKGQGNTRQSSADTNASSRGGAPGYAQERTMKAQDRTMARSPSKAKDGDFPQPSTKRQRQDAGSKPGQIKDLSSLLLSAHTARRPAECFTAAWQLGKRVKHDQQARQRYSDQQLHELEAAADALTATLLGSTPSSSSKHAAAPFQQLNSMQLSLTVWGLAYLADCSSSIKTRQLRQLVDGIAVHAVESSIMDQPADKACMHWARLLYSTAKLGIMCQDSQPVQLLFDVAAQKFPDMLRRKTPCAPQSISNTLWAFATAEYPGSLRGLVAEVAGNEARVMKQAEPQECSDALWALGTMADRRLDLGEGSNVDTIMCAGAASMTLLGSRIEPGYISRSLWGLAKVACQPHDSTTRKLAAAVAERASDASPQNLANTLWAVATLSCSPGASTVRKLAAAVSEHGSAAPQALSNTLLALAKLATLGCSPDTSTVRGLAAALAECSNDAAPQALSNTLWAVATLGCDPGASTVSKLAAAVADSSDANPQDLSNSLWALSELRWYDAVLYSKLSEGVLLKISSSTPIEVGQQFSNTMFSCALSCHFDSSVDALAEWGSQQSLQCWTEQALSNAQFAWAILSATAGGDTASMRKLAQRLFTEASRRGVADFQADPEWRHHMGKLFSAHQEALHVCLAGVGVSDGELLRLAQEDTERFQQDIGKELSHTTSAVSTALQGVYDVQPTMLQGYHTLLVSHPSCSRGVVIEVTCHARDYLNHPPNRLYGKAALRIEQVKRGCDALVLCDESELQAGSEQVRSALQQRIKQAVRG